MTGQLVLWWVLFVCVSVPLGVALHRDTRRAEARRLARARRSRIERSVTVKFEVDMRAMQEAINRMNRNLARIRLMWLTTESRSYHESMRRGREVEPLLWEGDQA